jgi:serine/threonine-protein kinase
MLGELLLGRYRVVSLLGEGSMGRVYLGEQRVGEATRRVAIKVLAAARGNDEYIVARFRREAATIASLEHPNLIRLYDYGEENGRFISVMEYVSGGSVASLLSRERVDPAKVEALAWQIAYALEEAHRRGVVHRDLKPENVLLAPAQEGAAVPWVVKVVDFGIARRPPATPGEKPLTMTGAMLGTPAYMAPEQFLGETVDARADVYALALVVYQLLAGVLPWNAVQVMEWAECHVNVPPVPLTSQPGCAGLPKRYELALAHALAKSPRDRTATALAFLRELTGAESARDPTPRVDVSPAVIGGVPSPDVPLELPVHGRGRGVGVALFALFALVSLGVGFLVVRSVLMRPSPRAEVAAASDHDAAIVLHDAGPPEALRRARAELEDGLRTAPRKLSDAIRTLTSLRNRHALPERELERLRAAITHEGDMKVQEILRSRSLSATRKCDQIRELIQQLAAVHAAESAHNAATGHCNRLPPAS